MDRKQNHFWNAPPTEAPDRIFSHLRGAGRRRSIPSEGGAEGWGLIELFSAAALWTGLNLIAGVLCVRMLAGAFSQPMSIELFGLSVLMAAGVGVLAFCLGRRAQDPIISVSGLPQNRAKTAVGLVSFTPVLLIASALSPPLSQVGWIFVGCCWVATFALIFLLSKREPARHEIRQQTEPELPKRTAELIIPQNYELTSVESAEVDDEIHEENLESDSEEISPHETADRDDASLWMKRRQGSDGADCLEGMTVAEFLPRQKQTAIHLAFCPPFQQAPEMVCTPVDDETVRVKIGVIYPYGARIDLKRSGISEAQATLHIHFSAVSAKLTTKTSERSELG